MAAVPAGTTARAEMQDWFAFPVYLSERVWSKIRSDERSLAKIDSVLKFLVELGLRHPSERTLAVVASLVAACTAEPIANEISRQTAVLATVKSVARTNITRAKQLQQALPAGYINVLPRNPVTDASAALMALFPHGFTDPPIPLEPVWERAVTWPLRESHSSVRLVKQQSLPFNTSAGLCPVAMAQQGFLQAAQMMMTVAGGAIAGAPAEQVGLQLTPAGLAAAERARGNARSNVATSLPALLDRAAEVVPQESSAPVQAPAAVSVVPPVGTTPEGQIAVVAVPETSTPAPVEQPVSAAQQELVSAVQAANLSATAPDSVLTASVARLADVHYGQELPETSGALRKPAAAKPNKKPAASKAVATLKRPSAASKVAAVKRPSAANVKQPVLKRPAAKAGDLTRVEAAKLRPNGCGKCRQQTGCTPSCWRLRGRNLVD